MRAFLIPRASPHNSHANRISRPRREVERARQKEQRDYYRHGRPTFAHNAARASVLLGGCFASCGRKFATIKYSTRTSPPASYYFAKCERTAARVPSSDRKKDLAPRRPRRPRNCVLAFPAQISERDRTRKNIFSLSFRRIFFFFFFGGLFYRLRNESVFFHFA